MVKKRVLLLVTAVLLVLAMGYPGGTAFASEGKVNINAADKEDLMTLKYVGEALAERIIEYREEHPFIMPEEIMNVKGIGKKIFEANKERIVCTEVARWLP